MNALPCPSSFPDYAAERQESRLLATEADIQQLVQGWLDDPQSLSDEMDEWACSDKLEQYDECFALMLKAAQGGQLEQARFRRFLERVAEQQITREKQYQSATAAAYAARITL